MAKPAQKRQRGKLPEFLRPFFWEYDVEKLGWPRDRHLVIDRILTRGDLTSVRWLRKQLGDRSLRAWIIRRNGLSSRQIRFWQLILDLPDRLVRRWLAAPALLIWENRRE